MPTQNSEHTQRNHRGAADRRFEASQFVDGFAEPSELFSQDVPGQRMSTCFFERRCGFDFEGRAVVGDSANSQRRINAGLDRHVDGHATLWFAGRERLPQLLCKLRVVGFPDLLTRRERVAIDDAVSKLKLHKAAGDGAVQLLPVAGDVEHAAALFVIVGSIAIKDDSIARRNRRGQLNADSRPVHEFHFAQEDAALCGTQAGHQHLVVAAAEPAGRKASRKRQLHFPHVLLGQRDRLAADG